jgi:hypothetical protein
LKGTDVYGGKAVGEERVFYGKMQIVITHMVKPIIVRLLAVSVIFFPDFAFSRG